MPTFRSKVPILAATNRPDVARRLMLCRGVVPVVTELGDDVGAAGVAIARELRERGLLAHGDDVVFVSVHEDLRKQASNFLKLYRVE